MKSRQCMTTMGQKTFSTPCFGGERLSVHLPISRKCILVKILQINNTVSSYICAKISPLWILQLN